MKKFSFTEVMEMVAEAHKEEKRLFVFHIITKEMGKY